MEEEERAYTTQDYLKDFFECREKENGRGNEDISPLPIQRENNRQVVEGIKYDKGKPRLAEMVVDFASPLTELCKVWEFGADKYSKSNWKLVDNGKDRYTNAMLRHLIAEEENPYDDESNLLHASHIAFNALARLYFIIGKTSKPIKLQQGMVYEMPTPTATIDNSIGYVSK